MNQKSSPVFAEVINQMPLPLCLANNFIEWGIRKDVPMTPLKLQKLSYLYYARYMHAWGIVPFEDFFEKWPKGPVLRSMYETLKVFGGEPIGRPLIDITGKINTYKMENDDFRPVFHDVIKRYGKSGAHELIRLTHDGPPGAGYETAWKKAPGMGYNLHLHDIEEDGRVLFG